MLNNRNYVGEARQKLESGDVDSTFLILAEGMKANDKKSLMAIYYAPKPENIKWYDKCNYLEKYFYQFDLDITFDKFQSEVGPVGMWELFRQCAHELLTDTDNLKTEDYYNWCLENKYKVSKKQIEKFWENFTKEYLKSSLLSMLKNLENINI